MNIEALKDLLYRMADDALIIGHRNSEWTGLGPILEEDIAFSSMSQDKIGHSQALYQIMHTIAGEKDPDHLAFSRSEKEYKCCQFVEFPIGEYDFSIMRQFLFDHAEFIRYGFIKESTITPLSQLARKVYGELKYHVLHADTWVKQLSMGTEESKARMQSALNDCYPMALGIFEEGDFEKELASEGIFPGESALKEAWSKEVSDLVSRWDLAIPKIEDETQYYGGRKGFHTEYLKPMLDEMTEVFSLDPQAEW